MKTAVLQMVSTPDLAHNLACAQQLVAQAAGQGAELLVLPEYFAGMGLHDHDKLAWAEARGMPGPMQSALSHWAQAYGIWLVGGSIPIQAEQPQRVHNCCTVWSPSGQCVAHYDKIHLFRFHTDREHYDESTLISPGHQPVLVPVQDRSGHVWQLGLSICYDLRFPELYRTYAAQGAHVLIAPSAFTWTTGQAHWELLLRARAVENQCWVVAAAQGGLHPNGRRTWGHSMVVDPWGQVVAEHSADGAGIRYAVLDAALLQQVRQRLPALEHRCL